VSSDDLRTGVSNALFQQFLSGKVQACPGTSGTRCTAGQCVDQFLRQAVKVAAYRKRALRCCGVDEGGGDGSFESVFHRAAVDGGADQCARNTGLQVLSELAGPCLCAGVDAGLAAGC
jgi:hypothetical protein